MAIATAVELVIMLPVHMIAMYTLFTKLGQTFNPDHIQAKQRHKTRLNKLTGRQV